MPAYFLDTSALAKVYRKELGSDLMDRIVVEPGRRVQNLREPRQGVYSLGSRSSSRQSTSDKFWDYVNSESVGYWLATPWRQLSRCVRQPNVSAEPPRLGPARQHSCRAWASPPLLLRNARHRQPTPGANLAIRSSMRALVKNLKFGPYFRRGSKRNGCEARNSICRKSG